MHIQGYNYRFDSLCITVALFANEYDESFRGEMTYWPGDDLPGEEFFCGDEEFVLRNSGLLIVGVSGISQREFQQVCDLIDLAGKDRLRLLVCEQGKRYKAPQFDAVISTTYGLLNSLHDLALALFLADNDSLSISGFSDLAGQIRASGKGTLVSHWDDRRNKSWITPDDIAREWPISMSARKKVKAVCTWLNPFAYKWPATSMEKFLQPRNGSELSRKCQYLCWSGNYDSAYKRNPAPEVVQLILS